MESAIKEADEKQKLNLTNEEKELACGGMFMFKSAIDSEDVQKLYVLLGEYSNTKGAKYGVSVIDTSKITLKEFDRALRYGCYTGFDENGLKDKLHFFICKFSDAYIHDSTAYRNRAALSMGIKYDTLTHYNKDDKFAAKLKEVLPLISKHPKNYRF